MPLKSFELFVELYLNQAIQQSINSIYSVAKTDGSLGVFGRTFKFLYAWEDHLRSHAGLKNYGGRSICCPYTKLILCHVLFLV